LVEYYRVTSEEESAMRTTKPITISLPLELLQQTQRLAREESRTRTDLIRDALRQYLATRRWQRLRQWGAETAERLGLKTEADLRRLLDTGRAARGKAAR
jgi:CopG family transcriptional regulator/antitoxin EndoAI